MINSRTILILLAAAAAVAVGAPVQLEEERKHLNVLFINDFTLNFVEDDLRARAASDLKEIQTPAQPVVCPRNSYPDAAAEYTFTTEIVKAIDESIRLELQYDVIRGGSFGYLSAERFSRDDFETGTFHIFRDFCLEGPEPSDLPDYVNKVLSHAVDTDVLVFFTASSATELKEALPITVANFKAVIVVGLKGADASLFYPDSSVTITDFNTPESIACMINVVYGNIHDGSSDSPVEKCAGDKAKKQ